MSFVNSKAVNNSIDNREPDPVKKRPSFLKDIRDKKKDKLGSVFKSISKSRVDPSVMQEIAADDLKDPDWVANKCVPDLVTSNAIPVGGNPNDPDDPEKLKQHQKKHQINWLAQETRQRDMQLLEKSAQGKQKQRSTAMKYGW